MTYVRTIIGGLSLIKFGEITAGILYVLSDIGHYINKTYYTGQRVI